MGSYGGVKQVIRGTVNRTDNIETSFVITIPTVDLNKTVITQSTLKVTSNNANTNSSYVVPAKITGATSLTFYFAANASDRTVEYELIEFY